MNTVLSLIFPTAAHKAAALTYRQEFFDNHEFYIPGDGGLDKAADYDEWLRNVQNDVTTARPGFVTATTYFSVLCDKIIGTIQIRHALNDNLLKTGGHIGYGIAPSERRKGCGTEQLRLALEKCRELGLPRVLITCDKVNVPSAKTIIKNGGVLEDEISEENSNITQRYWIELQ